jgi:hypothetical protein
MVSTAQLLPTGPGLARAGREWPLRGQGPALPLMEANGGYGVDLSGSIAFARTAGIGAQAKRDVHPGKVRSSTHSSSWAAPPCFSDVDIAGVGISAR